MIQIEEKKSLQNIIRFKGINIIIINKFLNFFNKNNIIIVFSFLIIYYRVTFIYIFKKYLIYSFKNI